MDSHLTKFHLYTPTHHTFIMGSKVSKPARKLAGSVGSSDHLAKVSRSKVQLPSAELMARSTQPPPQPNSTTNPSTSANLNTKDFNGSTSVSVHNEKVQFPQKNIPEGKDGMDPQADQKYIDLITNLGRQIHSKDVNVNAPQADVTALKQLLNRKKHHLAGQSEAQAHMDSPNGTGLRTVISPKTLTAIIDALNDPHSLKSDIAQDFQLLPTFLDGLSRYKVAHNVVMIEEHADEDQIGPVKGRRPTKEHEETPNVFSDDVRVKELQKRLE